MPGKTFKQIIVTGTYIRRKDLDTPAPDGRLALVSQSGALCTAILDWAASRQLGLAKLVSMGNKADLSEIDFLKAFANDDDTKVIVGYLESITDGNQFIHAAESASPPRTARSKSCALRPRNSGTRRPR